MAGELGVANIRRMLCAVWRKVPEGTWFLRVVIISRSCETSTFAPAALGPEILPSEGSPEGQSSAANRQLRSLWQPTALQIQHNLSPGGPWLCGVLHCTRPESHFFIQCVDGGGSITGGFCPSLNQPSIVIQMI